MKKILLITMLCCVFCTSLKSVYAQKNTGAIFRGVVKDIDGKPLFGVTVKEKEVPANSVSTDVNGNFQLTLSGNSKVIVISFIGYKRIEKKVTSASSVFVLQTEEQGLNDVVVVGYQKQTRRDVTAAISSVKGKDIANIPSASFDQTLQGRLAGVSVLSSTGELGSRPNIVIRGATNIDFGNANGGNTGPLYVIDGIIFDVNTVGTSYGNNNPLSLINPNDIESIDVLKDASASAIYGARGGNGVIIVKTKRPKRGRPQITGSLYAGVTTRPAFMKVVTGAAERRLKLNLLHQGLPYDKLALNDIPVQLTDSLNSSFNQDIDWQGLLVREKALVNSQDIGVSGYTGNTGYRISFNHYNEQGVLNGYGLEKFTPHLNLTIQPMKGMSLNTDILISSEKRSHGVGGQAGGLFNSWAFPSSFAQLNSDQKDVYSGKKHYYDDNRILTIVGSVGVVDTLAKNLTINSTYASTNYTDKYNYFSPVEINGVQNSAYSINSSSPSWSFENFLAYNKTVGNHNFILAAGASLYNNENNFSYAYGNGINISGINTIQTVPPGYNLSVTTSYDRKTTESYYARFNYNYSGKYLFMASFRRDASSIYSSSYRWATFPSFSAGWIASDESFFAPLKSVISFLKFRASWGITGNDPGNFYSKYQTLANDASYFGATTGTINQYGLTGTPTTYNGTAIVTPFPYYNNFSNFGVKSSNDVRWEKFPQYDLGADMELFGGRVNLTVDYYQKDAKDKYFYNVPAQPTSGYQYYSGNYVDIRNQGLEIGLNVNVLGPHSPLRWNANFNISYNKNYVTKLPNGNRDFLFDNPWFYKTLTLGEPIFNYKVFHTNGVYPTDASVPVDPITGKRMTYYGTTLQAGDPRYVDVNGDYNITNDDKTIGGNPNPKYTGGFGSTFGYKRITLSIFCSFVYGRKILNGALSDLLNGSRDYHSWGSTAGPAALSGILDQFWQKPGDQTKYPRLVYANINGTDPWNIGTDYFIEDGSFIKVKNISLGYDLPDSWVKRIGMRRVNIYGMADNVLIFKKSKLIADPELVDPTTGSSNVIYPTAAKFTLGLNFEL